MLALNQHFVSEDIKREMVVFTRSRNRWYTNEEVASTLTSFSSHPEWLTNELQIRPKSGAVLLYSREKVRYRQDGYCWKKRKNGRTTREDHMKLKVQGIECIYGCYVHSAILPTFHRRCYWLLQNPDIVLVHYLNKPPDDQNKMMITLNPSLLEADTRRSWTNEEIIEEIGAVFGGISQIQQTLNINFPPSTAIIQRASPTSDCNRNSEFSPQSQQSQVTSISEQSINSEQVGMTKVDQQQQQLQLQLLVHSASNHNDGRQDEKQENVDNEIMTVSNFSASSANTDLFCNQNNANESREDDSISMTFEMVGETHDDKHITAANDDNSYNNGEQVVLTTNCFPGLENHHQQQVSADGVNKTSIDVGCIGDRSQETQDGQLEQLPCSPVTQIYNKIVDDIETYALPLEPDQFSSDHNHNMTILPMQPMVMDSNERHENQSISHQQFVVGHHQHPARHGGPVDNSSDSEQRQTDCFMDLNSCDLFGNNPMGNDNSTGAGRADDDDDDDDDDNLLLTDFNLTPNDQVGDCVVDSMANVDDLRDLIMGISSTSSNADANVDGVSNSNLLIENNFLDLFNFKTSDCDDQSRQQLDVKSSISDTDTLNRLPPLIPVPRCNSTGNAMQPFSSRNYSQAHGEQYMSSQYLSFTNNQHQTNALITANTFAEFQDYQAHRSASSNPASSTTSCSPSPSFNTLSGQAQSACINSVAQQNPMGQQQPSIKPALQQRQNSEKQEPSNSVLNSLLPKALSLDGSEMKPEYRATVSPSYLFGDNNHQPSR